jgi:L-ribulose-5-phosphate 4-epimerase
MKLPQLRQQVLDANLEIVRRGLALFTFGNASGISRADGIVAIKPSGVPYDELTAAHIVLTDLDGNVVEGTLRPSSDLITHILLYRAFASIGGIVHTHSEYATAWAQSGLPIPPLGTTHADSFHGPVPITPQLSDEKISGDYVRETGIAIIERFRESNLDPVTTPGCLVAGHAPFSWGRSPAEAAKNAVLLESIARMATLTPGPSRNRCSIFTTPTSTAPTPPTDKPPPPLRTTPTPNTPPPSRKPPSPPPSKSNRFSYK